MERDQHQHLVWAGQSLVAASLNVLEEAVQQIRTAFLLPSKELKCDLLIGLIRGSRTHCERVTAERKCCWKKYATKLERDQ